MRKPSKYSKYDPNKVHIEHGQPVIYNKADNPISQWNAEREFKKAVSTMHTWAVRAFRLAAANPEADMRDYHLEHFEWELDNIETWLAQLRKAMEEARGKQREQETIDKLLALAERTTFPEEADTARQMAARRQANA